MKNLIYKYRGWLIACFMAVTLSVLISSPQIREISYTRLQKLIIDKEVAGITITQSKRGIPERYIAEITLTPAASEKYSQLTAGISPTQEVPHFVCSIGNLREEVDQWKEGLAGRVKIKVSF